MFLYTHIRVHMYVNTHPFILFAFSPGPAAAANPEPRPTVRAVRPGLSADGRAEIQGWHGLEHGPDRPHGHKSPYVVCMVYCSSRSVINVM